MAEHAIELNVKKTVERWRLQYQYGVYARGGLILTSLILAVLTAVFAFLEWATLDKIFSVCVAISLVIEGVCYGFTHWKENSERARECTELIEQARRCCANEPGCLPPEELRARQDALGEPDSAPIIFRIANYVNEKNWARRNETQS